MLDFTRYQYRCGYIISLDACQKYFTVGHQVSYDHIIPFVDHSGWKKMSAAERRLHIEEDRQFQLTSSFTSSFRSLRRRAPPDARLRLVLPHTWMREIPHENRKFGKCLHHGLFMPTDWGIGSKFREGGPSDVDRQRLQMFIDTMNGLFERDADQDGARFTPTDFTFETIPELALSGPLFDDKEMEELLFAGRQFLDFYGVFSPREFLAAYY